MAWIQYTRNFEDVMLRRALQGVERGCYLDVGASHPVVDSNTYALYQRGWRGIAVEPQPQFAGAWAKARPQDVFVSAAAGREPGEVALHVPVKFGQSATIHDASLARYRQLGLALEERRVPRATLDSVLEQHLGGRTLHLLSLDVEGAEGEAFAGLDLARHRPWLMIVEVTLPGSPQLAPCEWEPAVLAAGYEVAYFDGVNRFYLAREQAALKAHFTLPPNVWDDFVDHRLVQAAKTVPKR